MYLHYTCIMEKVGGLYNEKRKIIGWLSSNNVSTLVGATATMSSVPSIISHSIGHCEYCI